LACEVLPFVPLVGAGEPWACACVVWAGEFCDENLELKLDIHEFLRDGDLNSGGVTLPGLSGAARPSMFGRFVGIFCADVGGVVADDGKEDCWTAGAGSGVLRSAWGRPPCDDVRGRVSFGRPGDDGAC
jgi:hypothetical protein